MADFEIAALTPETWPAFEALAERHNGVWGGCWCTFFHCLPENETERKGLGARAWKQALVERGVARAALVMDGDEAVAWAEFGTPGQLPNIHHRKQWEAETEQPPDYRITCLFVDRRYRRDGMAERAVQGALTLIAAEGGGLVESYPHDLEPERRMSASFLYNATRTMYERLGFTYVRPKGKGNCVMTLQVAPA